MMNLRNKHIRRKKQDRAVRQAQVSIEFMFCMIIILLLMYATIMIFRWTGLDLAERRRAHDFLLYSNIIEDWGPCMDCNYADPPGCSGCPGTPFLGPPCTCLQYSTVGDGPLKQIDPYFYKPIKMNAVFNNVGMLN